MNDQLFDALATPGYGNIAPIGKLLRDGKIDAFQARAMLPLITERRFRMFYYRWALMGGKWSDARAGIHMMLHSASWSKLPSAVDGEGC